MSAHIAWSTELYELDSRQAPARESLRKLFCSADRCIKFNRRTEYEANFRMSIEQFRCTIERACKRWSSAERSSM